MEQEKIKEILRKSIYLTGLVYDMDKRTAFVETKEGELVEACLDLKGFNKAVAKIMTLWEDTEVEIGEEYQTHLDKYHAQLAEMREALQLARAKLEWTRTSLKLKDRAKHEHDIKLIEDCLPRIKEALAATPEVAWSGKGLVGYAEPVEDYGLPCLTVIDIGNGNCFHIEGIVKGLEPGEQVKVIVVG